MPAERSSLITTPTKPYAEPEPDIDSVSPILAAESVIKTKTKTKTRTKSGGTPTKGKPWTGEEYQMLFQHAIKHGAPGSDSGWEGVVPGRTGGQARNAWRYV
jgi:hypothetical protein